MNLVQIQERLKDLPLAAIKNYANGANPEVPAYMALGEMKRRETMEKDAALHQQAQQGPQPTVKDQVEKQVGLMALQRQQQQQAQQNQMQAAQSQPQPVPPGIPQPVAQEEAEPEMAMATGGVAALPVKNEMFEYGSGGIISFDGEDGSEVPAADPVQQIMDRTDLTPEQKKAMLVKLQQANQPAPKAKAGIASMVPDTTQSAALANQLLAKEPQRPTAANIVQEEQGLRPEELNTPYGAEAKQRIAGLESLYKQQMEERPQERLMAVLAGMSRGSLGGAAPAYLNAVESERAADMAHAQKMHEALTGVEKGARDEAKDIYGKRSDMYKSAMSNFSEAERNRLTAAVQKFGYDQASADRALERITQIEAAKIQASVHNRPGETERMMAQYAALKEKDPAAAERWMQDLERIKTGSRGEMSRAALVEKFAKDWNSMDPVARENYKKEGIKTVDDYIEKMARLTGGTVPTNPTGGIKSSVEAAGYQYEPNKYDYRINPDTGAVQRKPKE